MRKFFILLLCISLLVLPASADPGANYVALTFDDGPSGHFTRQLLQGLEQRSVKATFLLCGYRVAEFPGITQQIFDEGHEIGCHGYTHKNMEPMSRREVAAEIDKMLTLLPPNCKPVFLRPPGGNSSESVAQVAKAKNLAILTWSVDPQDWATQDTLAVEDRVLKEVKDGDIILLHDMSDSSVQAALDIVDSLKARGFRFVTVSELARLRGVKVKPGESYRRFAAG